MDAHEYAHALAKQAKGKVGRVINSKQYMGIFWVEQLVSV